MIPIKNKNFGYLAALKLFPFKTHIPNELTIKIPNFKTLALYPIFSIINILKYQSLLSNMVDCKI